MFEVNPFACHFDMQNNKNSFKLKKKKKKKEKKRSHYFRALHDALLMAEIEIIVARPEGFNLHLVE